MAGLDPLSLVGDAAGIGLGTAEFFGSLSKEKKDQKELADLRQPFFQVQQGYVENRNIAAANAGQGLPSATRQYETQQAERGLGAGLDAILRSGGGVNDAALLTQQYNDKIGKIGSEDASMHMQNLQYFMKANSDLAGEKTKQWTINEYQPYEAKLKELKDSIKTDEQNKWAGLSTAVGSLSAGATSQLNSKLFGGGGSKGVSDPYSAASGYTAPDLASVGGSAPSVAGGIGSINPASFSQAAIVPDVGTIMAAGVI